MTHLRQAADPQPRLLRIDLPGMHVEHGGTALAIQPADSPRRPGVRQQSKIGTSRHRKIDAAETYRRRWELEQGARRAPQHVNVTPGLGDAVAVVLDGEDAGVV